MLDMDTLKALARRFWWLRGVVAAATLTTLVQEVFDLSRIESLRALLAVILGWNEIAAVIGLWIGHLPWMPQLRAVTVNMIALTSTIGIPLVVGLHSSRNNSEKHYHTVEGFFGRIRSNFFTSLNRWVSNRPLVAKSVTIYAIVVVSPTVLLLPASMYMYISLDFNINSYAPIIFTSMLFLLVVVMAIRALPQFGRGLFLFATFVLAIQLLYLARLPFVTEAINDFACRSLPENALGC